MKILFVIPPYRTTDTIILESYPQPYAAVLMGTVLKSKGHKVKIKDFMSMPGKKVLGRCIKAPASFKGMGQATYRHWGTPMDEAKKWLKKYIDRFDVVGLCGCQCNVYEGASEIGRYIKQLGKPLVAGGPFVTTAPKQARKLMWADVAVVGEGERVCEDAFKRAIKGWKGIIKAKPMSIADIPVPNWDLAPQENYPLYNGKLRGVLTISRGCPFTCKFCSVWTVMGRGYRRQKPERVKQELLNLFNRGVRFMVFLDDNLFVSKKESDILLDIIEDLCANVKGFKSVRFYVEEGIEIRIAAIPGIIKRIADNGFINLSLAVESMDAARLKQVKKPYNPKHLEAAIKNVHDANLTPRGFYIIGLPGDTIYSVCEDIKAFSGLGLIARVNNMKLYPGTEMTDIFLEKGYIDKNYDWRLSAFHTPDTKNLKFADIRKLKNILRSMATAVDMLRIDPFSDSILDIKKAMKKRHYKMTTNKEDGSVKIIGNMWRPSPFKRIAEILVLRRGAAGAGSINIENEDGKIIGIEAYPTNKPANNVQEALKFAIQGKKRHDLIS